MNRRDFLLSASAGSAVALGQGRNSGGQRPNILLILADDLPAWVLGCYGNKEFRTPHIDALARTGMRFSNSFVVSPICSASRATLFTGRVPRQHGIHDFLTDNPIEQPPQGQKAPPASFAQEVMLSDLLSRAGYDCGYVGKWHMGEDRKPGHSFSYSYTMTGGQRSYRDPEMFLNGQAVQEKGYLADLMTQRASEYLDQQTAARPFFLTVGYLNPHTPYTGHPQKLYDLYAKTTFETVGYEQAAPNALREKEMLQDIQGNLRRAGAATTALDDQVAALLSKLRAKGFADNTLIVFTSDNGYLLGRHGLWSKGLASDPINMYEEVVRVPLIFSWPGKIPAEANTPELVSFTDMLPTLCQAAGVAPPADRNLIGQSFLSIAQREVPDRKAPRRRNLVFGHFRNTEMARDPRYKLVLRNGGEGPNELFNLVEDPRERTNHYDNPAYITVRQRLTKDLAEWRQRTSK